MAENRLPADDSARLHLASCSECFAEYRGYRGSGKERRSARKRIAGWLAAACILAAAGGGAWLYQLQKAEHRRPGSASLKYSSRDAVNLFDEERYGDRGDKHLAGSIPPAEGRPSFNCSAALQRSWPLSDPGVKDKAGMKLLRKL